METDLLSAAVAGFGPVVPSYAGLAPSALLPFNGFEEAAVSGAPGAAESALESDCEAAGGDWESEGAAIGVSVSAGVAFSGYAAAPSAKVG